MLKVFLSWSGSRSKFVASRLREWLPLILPVEPWMSDDDLAVGIPWTDSLTKELKECPFAILCLTSENICAPWIIYEAGSIANSVGRSHVAPYLLDTDPNALPAPLKQFRAVTADKSGTLKLLKSINQELDNPMDEKSLHNKFIQEWYALEPVLSPPVEGIRHIDDIDATWALAQQMVKDVPKSGFIFDTTGVKNQPKYEKLIEKRAADGVGITRIVATERSDIKIEEFIRPPWCYKLNSDNVHVLHYPHPLPFDILVVQYAATVQVIIGFKNSSNHNDALQYQSALHAFSPGISKSFLNTYQNFLVKESHLVQQDGTQCLFCKSATSNLVSD